jgi:hypothetical protein
VGFWPQQNQTDSEDKCKLGSLFTI